MIRGLLCIILFSVGTMFVACEKPTYPACKVDSHCVKGETCQRGQCTPK